jgi:hypothetical protein
MKNRTIPTTAAYVGNEQIEYLMRIPESQNEGNRPTLIHSTPQDSGTPDSFYA